MQHDFSQIEETGVENYVNLDPGWYTVSIHEVREGRTRDGDPRWGLKLAVAEGRFAGRFAAWDGIQWSERGARRAKLVLDALGFDTSGVVDIEPHQLLGRTIDVELQPEEYQNPQTGKTVRRNRVTFGGWAPAGGAPVVEAGSAVDAWRAGEEAGEHDSPAPRRDDVPF